MNSLRTQSSEKVQRQVGSMSGIDLLLQAVAPYKGKDPQTAEVGEMGQGTGGRGGSTHWGVGCDAGWA